MMSDWYISITNLQRQNEEKKISFVIASKTYKIPRNTLNQENERPLQ